MARKTAVRTGESSNGQAAERGDGNGSASQEAQSNSITTEEIAARAYDIYEREGRVEGRDMDHWLRAEAELRSERSARAKPEPTNPQQNLPRSARLQQEQRESESRAPALAGR
jgi:hypothetical protein